MRQSAEGGPIRVLFVDNSYTFGGAILSLSRLASSLDRTRIRPVIVSAQPKSRLAELFQPGEAVHLPMWVPWEDSRRTWLATKVPGASALRSAWQLVVKRAPTARRIAAIGRETGAEAVHLNNALEGQVDGLLAARLLHVPCVAHARGFQTARRSLRIYARMPAMHVAISGSIARNLVEIGVDESRIRVIHNGIDSAAFELAVDVAAVRRSIGLPPEALVFGFFGRIVPWKGLLEFVEAASAVTRSVPGAYALIVGDASDGSEEYVVAVHERVKELGIEDRVVFAGYRENVAPLMMATDIVVHTSIEPEPFGLVVVEGMAAGKPVIAADRGGPRDIVVEGETGHLVDPTDRHALTETILRLLRDPARAHAMGEAGRTHVRASFSQDAVARSIERLYQELIDQGRLSIAR